MKPRKRPAAPTKRSSSSGPHNINASDITLDPLFDGQVDYLLRMIRIRELRAIETVIAPIGVALSAWYPLAVLREVDGLSQRDLGRRLSLKDAAIGQAVDAMERLGIVERMVGKDRRKALVYLTESGRKVADEIADCRQQLLAEMLTGFSEREIAQFAKYLERAYRNLDEFLADGEE